MKLLFLGAEFYVIILDLSNTNEERGPVMRETRREAKKYTVKRNPKGETKLHCVSQLFIIFISASERPCVYFHSQKMIFGSGLHPGLVCPPLRCVCQYTASIR